MAEEILFISDLHLAAERPQIIELFGAFVDAIAVNADTLYILGDFLEYWVGDDDPATGIDKLLRKISGLTVSDILNTMGAEISVSVKPSGKQDFDILKDGPSIEGTISANAFFKLVPGETIGSDLSLDVRNLSASLEDQIQLKNLTSRLNYSKYYKLTDRNDTIGKADEPLSQKVLEIETDFPVGRSASNYDEEGSAGSFRKFVQTLQTRYKTQYALTMDACEVYGAPVPVSITNVEADLNFNHSLIITARRGNRFKEDDCRGINLYRFAYSFTEKGCPFGGCVWSEYRCLCWANSTRTCR